MSFYHNQLKNWNYVQILDNRQYRSVIHKEGEKQRGSSLFGSDFKVESLFRHAARGTPVEPELPTESRKQRSDFKKMSQ